MAGPGDAEQSRLHLRAAVRGRAAGCSSRRARAAGVRQLDAGGAIAGEGDGSAAADCCAGSDTRWRSIWASGRRTCSVSGSRPAGSENLQATMDAYNVDRRVCESHDHSHGRSFGCREAARRAVEASGDYLTGVPGAASRVWREAGAGGGRRASAGDHLSDRRARTIRNCGSSSWLRAATRCRARRSSSRCGSTTSATR